MIRFFQHLPVTYSVHMFPVPQQLSPTGERCSEQNVGEKFNPLAVAAQSSSSEATSDQHEVGK